VGFNLKAAGKVLAAYLQCRRRVVGAQSLNRQTVAVLDALRLKDILLCGWTLDRRR
jgi:hypothetical protein